MNSTLRLFFFPFLMSGFTYASTDTITEFPIAPTAKTTWNSTTPVRGVHITAWSAGSKKYRAKLNSILQTTTVNSIIIGIKEYQGEVYLPGSKAAQRVGAYVPAVPDLAEWVQELNQKGIYTVARIVVFRDNIYPRKNPSTGVKHAQGHLWEDRTQTTWIDPYNAEGWRYNTAIAVDAARMGFHEIQFDYIRFPTDGALSQMRFIKPYKRTEASNALVGFLKHAREALSPYDVKISIDVFGLTTSDNTGMGIGQLIGPMSEQVDYVCPMIYPSHYARGEYGIPIPNDEPYKVVHRALRDAIRQLGPAAHTKLRPYLQDFSLRSAGIPYRRKEVEAQIQAAADLGISSWNLWNAASSYTWDALKTPIAVREPWWPKPKLSEAHAAPAEVIVSTSTN